MIYPEENHIIHWKQNVSPLDFTESSSTDDIGYTPIGGTYQLFKGLMRSTTASILLDGYAGRLTEFAYAIGMTSTYTNKYIIPGPMRNFGLVCVCQQEIWMRVCDNIRSCKYTHSYSIFLPSIILGFIGCC